MSKKTNFIDMLISINDLVRTTNLDSTGAIGEIVAEIILLKAFDVISHNLKPITVRLFLKSLVGEENLKIIENCLNDHSYLFNGLVCFNHFIKKFDDLTYSHAIRDFIGRAAAGQFKDKHVSYDLFIPILLENDELSYIFVQVKNAVYVSANAIANKINESKQFETYFKGDIVKTHISIIMSLGTTKDKFQFSSENNKFHFFISGFESYSFIDEEERNLLSNITNCDRFHLLTKKYDQDIVKEVTVGSYGFDAKFK